MVIANESYGRKNIKDELKEEMSNIKGELKKEILKLETKMDVRFTVTQTIIVEGAESTMKALKGNTKPMEEFLKKAEKYRRNSRTRTYYMERNYLSIRNFGPPKLCSIYILPI